MAETIVGADSLRAFTQELFARVGVPSADAAIQADVLVWANLRGVDSHGVLRIPWYVELLESGLMKARPNVRVVVETPAVLLIEADHAPGPIVTTRVMEQAIGKAREAGICWALLRNTTHQGALGYYTSQAARAGMAGIAIVCSPPNMAPYGAKAPGLHNSPISIAVPAGRHGRLMLDMATSVAAGGKLQLARDKGLPLPPGWALDRQGNPTTDARQAATLMPMAGPKGSGLALMFECLASLMVGNPLLIDMLHGRETVRRHRQNGIVAAIDIARFTALERYREDADSTVDGLKSLPGADGADEILVPGEWEDRIEADRRAHGIPLPDGTLARIRPVAERLGVSMPW
ncbi:MAG: Ldh family oxidoreductase [Candidatus Methylomirabilota bacterium]